MSNGKTEQTVAGKSDERDRIYASYLELPNDQLVLGTLYVQNPEAFRKRMRGVASRIGYPEGTAVNVVWKFGRYPLQENESPAAYNKRLAKMPNPNAIFVTSDEFLQ